MKKSKQLSKAERHFCKGKLYTLMLLALSGTYAHAQSEGIYEWNGSVSNSVGNEPGNWSFIGEDPISSGSQVIINSSHSANGQNPTWVVDGGHIDVGSGYYANNVKVGQGSGSNGVLDIKKPDYDGNNTWSYSYLHQLHVGTQGGTGTVNIYTNDTHLDAGGYAKVVDVSGDDGFKVGTDFGSQGTVNVLGSGKTTQMQRDFNSTLSVSSWSEGYDVEIGSNGGNGTLNIDGGSVDIRTYGSKFSLGSGTGSNGTVNVLSGGKAVHNVNSYSPPGEDGVAASIGGDAGHGMLHISGRSAHNDAISRGVFGSGITVGQGSGSLGEVYITQGAELVTSTTMYWDNQTGEEKLPLNQVGVDNGTGRIVIDGVGSIWKVIGHTYFSGGMPGEVGELHLGSSGTGELTVSNGGRLSIGQSEYMYGNFYDPQTGMGYTYHYEGAHDGGLGTLYLADEAGSTGIINIGASAGQAAQGTGALDVLGIQFGDGSGTVVFNHTDDTGSYVFDTPLFSGNGQGTIRQIAGTTVFADQAGYTGDISVEGGKLLINGTQAINEGRVSGGIFEVNGDYTATDTQVTGGYFELLGQASGPITVSGSGTFSGNGTAVGDVVVNAGGTVAPGALLGAELDVLTVNSLVFNQGSVYQAHSNPDGTGDLLYATTAEGGSGDVAIHGGDVSVIAEPGEWQQNTKYHIIKTDSGLSGVFDGVTTNLAFLDPSLEYDSMNAYLYLARNSTGFGDVGSTYNQRGAGAGIESLGNGNVVYDSVVSMSADQARAAFDNLSGEIHAGVKSALLSNSRYARSAVNQHLSGYNNRQEDPSKNLWINTWAHDGHIKADGNATRLDNQGWGFLAGWDVYNRGVTTIGIAAGYEQTRLKAGNGRHSDADVDALHLMGYGRTTVGSVDLKGGVGYSWMDVDSSRHIDVAGLEGENKAGYHGGLFQVFGEASHTFELSDRVQLTPYVNLTYQNIRMGGFAEKGNAAALHHRRQSADQISSTIGARSLWKLSESARLYAGLGWQHGYGSQTVDTDLSFVGGGSMFNVRAPRSSQDSALVDVGAAFQLKPNMRLSIGYSGEYGSRNQDHAARILWELKF